MDLREKLESDPNAQMMTSEHARDIAVAFLTRGARVALEMVGCQHGIGDVTCVSEGTPPVRWCRPCTLLASLDEKVGR